MSILPDDFDHFTDYLYDQDENLAGYCTHANDDDFKDFESKGIQLVDSDRLSSFILEKCLLFDEKNVRRFSEYFKKVKNTL